MINLKEYNDLKVSERISDTLDNALVSVLTDKEIEYTKFEITEFNGVKWAVFNINYTHNNLGVLNEISLIEPTKMLENYIKVGMAFTDYNNLFEELADAIIKFDADLNVTDLSDFINVKGIDLKYQGAITLREVLDDMLSSVDCAIRYDGISLRAENINKRGNLIELPVYAELNNSVDAEYDVGGAIATADNVFSEKNVVETLVARNQGGVFDNTKGTFYTQYPIINVNSFKVKTDFFAEGTFDAEKTFKGNIVVDLTQFLYEYNQWLLLPSDPNTTTLGTQEASFYYKLKDNEISGLLDLYKPNGLSFSQTALSRMYILIYDMPDVSDAIKREIMKIALDSGIANVDIKNFRLGYDNEYPQFAIVDYDPIFTAYLNTEKDSRNTRILMNNNAEQVNLRAFSKNVQGAVERMGNRELSVNVQLNNISELLNLHDYTADNYIIDERNYAVKNNYIVAQYHLTKNFNNIAENIKIKREKRLYNIPDDAIIRISDIASELKVTDTPTAPRNRLLSRLTLETLKGFNNFPVENFKIETTYKNGNKSENGNIPLITYASENAVYLSGKCYDNYAVGYYVNNDNVTQPMPYVDKNGEFNSVKLTLCSRLRAEYLSEETAKQLPRIRPFILFASPYYKEYAKLNKKIIKDKYETSKFVIKIGIKPEINELYLGTAFYKYNAIISNKNIYPLQTRFGDVWSDSDESVYTENYSTASFELVGDNGLKNTSTGLELYNYYEVVTKDGELLMRCSSNANTLYFY